ncbi:MAG: hypothetical protein ACT4RN_11890 [Pseudonocardia sp.]
MVQDARLDEETPRAVPVVPAAPATSVEGAAFAAWSAAFAVGALIHSWQGMQVTLAVGVVGTAVAAAAVAVLLAPRSPARLMVLLAALLVEIVVDLPDLVNHLVVVGVLGVTLVPWWLVLRWRDPGAANDPAVLHARVGPYLRLAFVLTFAFAALAKLNSGFLDVAGTCSVAILDAIPLVATPAVLAPAAIAGTVAVELAIPALLAFHRTRPFAIVLGFGFHLVSAFAGHASFSGFAWSFYLLFLPPAMVALAARTAGRAAPDRLAGLWRRAVVNPAGTIAAFVVVWLLSDLALTLLPSGVQWRAHWMTAGAVCTVWMAIGAWLLWVLRRHWLPARGPRASLRVTSTLMVLGIGLLVFTAAMPYLGLKTRAAFTMFSNVRTEPGHWSHLFLPEAMRVFDWQDGEVRFLGTDEPTLDAAIRRHTRAERTVLVEARRLVAAYPDANVRYELDGVERLASPVSDDDVLGRPLSPWQSWIGAMRPYTDEPRCQH